MRKILKYSLRKSGMNLAIPPHHFSSIYTENYVDEILKLQSRLPVNRNCEEITPLDRVTLRLAPYHNTLP